MKKYITYNIATHFLILISVALYSGAGISALYGDSQWLVEKGDSVYSIARKVFPDDAGKQRQFRQELVAANPAVFRGNANQLSVGDRLELPGFVVSQPVLPEKTVEIEQVVPVVAVEEKVTVDPEEIIGRVVISRGDMQASNRGVFRKLLRHSDIIKGDVLTTSARSYTQIRMKDGALISLRPNTELVITDYNFNGEEDGSERSFFELLRGGFRTITGYIGHRNKNNYRVKTAVATIGIRGTHYALMVCAEGSCNAEHADLKDGVYGGVVDGSIVVNNEAGEFTFNNDQYFYVASLTDSAVEQLVPPPVFHGKSEKQAGRESNRKDEGAGERHADNNADDADGKPDESNGKMHADNAVKKRVSQETVRGDRLGSLILAVAEDRVKPVLPPDKSRDQIKDGIATAEEPAIEDIIPGATGKPAPDGAGMLVAFTSFDESLGQISTIAGGVAISAGSNNSITLGSVSDVGGTKINNIPLAVREESGGTVRNLVLPSGVKGISDTGGNAIGVNWGRWSSDFVFTEAGAPVKTFGNLHYIYSDKLTSPSQLAALGGLGSGVSYNLAGGTTPTNAAGQAGSLSALNITADFITGSINYQITGTNGGTVFAMEANGVAFTNMADFNLNGLAGTPCFSGCEGGASAAFVGNNAEGVITTYSIQETGGGNGLNGASALVR